jgi:hypothetical protein
VWRSCFIVSKRLLAASCLDLDAEIFNSQVEQIELLLYLIAGYPPGLDLGGVVASLPPGQFEPAARAVYRSLWSFEPCDPWSD